MTTAKKRAKAKPKPPGKKRPPGRPSRIYEMIREGLCVACGDWIREPVFRAHVEREHPKANREELWAGFQVREVYLRDRILEYVAAGNYLVDACGASGISADVVKGWVALGKEWETPGSEPDPLEIPPERRMFSAFSLALAHARAESRARRVRAIERAGETDWKAHAWILERTAPNEFGRVDRLRLGGEDGGPVRVIHEEKDPDFISDVMRIYAEQGVVPGVDSLHNGNGHKRNGKVPKEEE